MTQEMRRWTQFIYAPKRTNVGWKLLRLFDRVLRGIGQVLSSSELFLVLILIMALYYSHSLQLLLCPL